MALFENSHHGSRLMRGKYRGVLVLKLQISRFGDKDPRGLVPGGDGAKRNPTCSMTGASIAEFESMTSCGGFAEGKEI
jgi:hypothetical protein